MANVTISRRFDFSSSHRYYRDDWTEAENTRVFGLCALPNGHGHNYTLEVAVGGDPDSDTGMVINLVDLKSAVDGVLVRFDHKHLNLDTPYFTDRIPTTENLATVLWELIVKSLASLPAALAGWRLTRIRLYETEEIFVEYYGGAA